MAEIIKIPGTKINIVKDFYDSLFSDMKGKVLIVVRPENEEEKTITHYINVNNIDLYIKKIEKLGGTVKVSKTAVSRMGYFIEATDPEGHFFGLWEENEDAEM